ncbi:hypothetical protein CCMA1212_001528 [Trichoderma ghanense]|uniref:Uncharacterized protein n=1 Tax=Trichoderma ghanense TaxID=65468 RepID=A0ABY2HD62_9HYPO
MRRVGRPTPLDTVWRSPLLLIQLSSMQAYTFLGPAASAKGSREGSAHRFGGPWPLDAALALCLSACWTASRRLAGSPQR